MTPLDLLEYLVMEKGVSFIEIYDDKGFHCLRAIYDVAGYDEEIDLQLDNGHVVVPGNYINHIMPIYMLVFRVFQYVYDNRLTVDDCIRATKEENNNG